jgi:HEAT repeat protein
MSRTDPKDPITGKPGDSEIPAGTGPDAVAEAARRSGALPPAPESRRSRPPLWLVVLTLAIPVTIGLVWYSNWYGRKLSANEIVANLSSENVSNQSHALQQFGEHLIEWRSIPSADPYKSQKLVELEGVARSVLAFASRPMSKDIEESAARALGVIAEMPMGELHSQARSHLEDMLIDGRKIVRFQAAFALSKFGDNSQPVIDVLRLALADDDARCRLNAVYALGKVGDRRVADLLQQRAVSDSNAEVRFVALAAYEQAKSR